MARITALLLEGLDGLPPRPRRALGVVHLRLLGLDDEHWTIAIATAGVVVRAGAPDTAHVQLYGRRRDFDALLEGVSAPRLDFMRFIGSREVLDHLALLIEAGSRLLTVRARHQARHELERFREMELV